jgi:DNA-binding transcriptional LysR family regulator
LNTRFLATLCAVADTGSLAAAARALNLSNAAVAEQIQTLERELGTRLVQRQGRSVALTSEGFAVVDASREILTRVSDLKQVAQLDQLRGSLRIGSVSTALISIVPLALETIARHHPSISINILPGTSTHLYRMLEMNEIDCAVTIKPRTITPKDFGWRLIRREPLTLISPYGLQCETIKEYISSKPLIRMDRKSATGVIVTEFLDDAGISPNELFEMDAQETIVMLVSQGLGISLLPDYGFGSYERRPIRKIIISETRFLREVGILFRQGAKRALVNAFYQSMMQALNSA